MHRLSLWTLAACTLMGTPFVYAQAAWQQCTSVIEDAQRLACYDQVAQQSATLSEQGSKAVDLSKTVSAKLENSSAEVVFAQEDNDYQAKLAQSGLAAYVSDAQTPLSKAWDLDRNDESGIFSVREHHPIALTPAWYNSKRNDTPQSPTRQPAQASTEGDKNVEARMEISFKTKLAEDLFKTRADLWFGYTQVSHWQVYNRDNSAPFRNNDYEPELILTQPVKMDLPFDGQLRMLGVGLVHQSNGRAEPLSRSWNRAYVMAGMEWGKLTVMPRVWMRVDGDHNDDNPDITDYLGYGDIKASYQLTNQHSIEALGRFNPATGKGAMELDYTFPIKNKLKGYVRYFDGYGMNLLDYNHYNRSIGVGIKLTDWHSL